VKRLWLADVAAAGQRRGRGFNYFGRRPRTRASGLELRARLLLGAQLHSNRRRRPRIALFEHVLLRRRDPGSAADATGSAMKVSAVVHAGEGQPHDRSWRRQVAAMLRANTPAHIGLDVHFVDREEWVRLKPLYRLWRDALRSGYDAPADMISQHIRQVLTGLESEREHG
jgi:hypothetical protein